MTMKDHACAASYERLIHERVNDFLPAQIFDAYAHQCSTAAWLGGQRVEGLFSGLPDQDNDHAAINRRMLEQVRHISDENSRLLGLAVAEDSPDAVAEQIRNLGLVGIQPAHSTPEWMWELCH